VGLANTEVDIVRLFPGGGWLHRPHAGSACIPPPPPLYGRIDGDPAWRRTRGAGRATAVVLAAVRYDSLPPQMDTSAVASLRRAASAEARGVAVSDARNQELGFLAISTPAYVRDRAVQE